MASTTAQASLTATTTGNGATVDFGTAKRNVTMVIFATGLVTGGVISIEASQDAVNWVAIRSVEAGARVRSVDITSGAYRYWRAVVADTVKGGGTASATFMEAD
jgi:hypothetical protein